LAHVMKNCKTQIACHVNNVRQSFSWIQMQSQTRAAAGH
jgi:hypothetical protein